MTVEVLEISEGRQPMGAFRVPAKRVALCAMFGALSLFVGWYAHARLAPAPAPVARLDIVQNAVVLTPTGDPAVQIAVANYGGVQYRLTQIGFGKHMTSSPDLIVAEHAAAIVTAPVDCASLKGRRSMPQLNVRFESSEGDVAQFGYLPPTPLLELCANLG